MHSLTPPSTRAEPTRALPLRWGSYNARLVAGASAILLGVASVLFTSTYSLPFLAVGSLLQMAGWIVLPARGWRRLVALMPALFVSWLMLAGSDFAVFTTVILAGWLLVMQRPPLAWITLALPLAAGLACSVWFASYEQNWAVFALSGVAVLIGARLARRISRVLPARSGSLEA
ncbi:hypothetical protein [Microterricola viridarii]|uniref:Uncharacterized protein n=1 Tax=Microterricola viridarii TaxID=412690 RepID=A0A1H1QBZ6_9MICO|nr:hypothetical protein [Microterricola viridarii]SDS20409.1 hypothetical protein SAMN04489834_1047 [Microterricola viridarii]